MLRGLGIRIHLWVKIQSKCIKSSLKYLVAGISGVQICLNRFKELVWDDWHGEDVLCTRKNWLYFQLKWCIARGEQQAVYKMLRFNKILFLTVSNRVESVEPRKGATLTILFKVSGVAYRFTCYYVWSIVIFWPGSVWNKFR